MSDAQRQAERSATAPTRTDPLDDEVQGLTADAEKIAAALEERTKRALVSVKTARHTLREAARRLGIQLGAVALVAAGVLALAAYSLHAPAGSVVAEVRTAPFWETLAA